MASISVSLVRKVHGFTAEELETLDILELNNQGLNELDNLEVFSQIRELHLSGNAISVIENLEFLSSLEFLDLSFNQIGSEGLRTGFGCLPQSLQTLNLTGNPCAEDEALLMELQDRMPRLGIIVGMEQEPTALSPEKKRSPKQRSGNQAEASEDGPCDNGPAEDDNDNDDDGVNEEDEDAFWGEEEAFGREREDADDAAPLDADEVLKAIVSRKCRLQNEISGGVLDLVTLSASLTSEADEAFNHRRSAKRVVAPRSPRPVAESEDSDAIDVARGGGGNAPSEVAFSWSRRAEGLRQHLMIESEGKASSSLGFVERLGEQARRRRDERFAKIIGERDASGK